MDFVIVVMLVVDVVVVAVMVVVVIMAVVAKPDAVMIIKPQQLTLRFPQLPTPTRSPGKDMNEISRSNGRIFVRPSGGLKGAAAAALAAAGAASEQARQPRSS
ncbi:hypothetical protein E2C01_058227 [Portunus trituberculatus]|uniref:Uncharacterized protein n=1 Tax=Portunus trituberculatus TaxID=210409 RepID=A0A5B7H2M6_PORTR|nr:hypothetical protein [Portunus trituberculatus]